MTTRTAIGVAALVCIMLVYGAEEKKPGQPQEPAKKEEQKVDLVAQLENQKKRLAELLIKYIPQDPIVIAQKRRIAELEEQIAKSKPKEN